MALFHSSRCGGDQNAFYHIRKFLHKIKGLDFDCARVFSFPQNSRNYDLGGSNGGIFIGLTKNRALHVGSIKSFKGYKSEE